MKARLSPDELGVECAGCGRVVAGRAPEPGGTHGVYIGGDWIPAQLDRLSTDGAAVFERNWRRLEAGRPRRHWKPTAPRRLNLRWSALTILRCACGEELELDWQELRVDEVDPFAVG